MSRKEIILDNCPIHNCQPLTYEKDGELLGYDISPYDRNGRLWKNDRWYVMQQLFPAAQIFDIGYIVFCLECAKKVHFHLTSIISLDMDYVHSLVSILQKEIGTMHA